MDKPKDKPKSGGAGQTATLVVLFLALLAVVVGLILFTTGTLGGNRGAAGATTNPHATNTPPSSASANTFTAPGYYSLTLLPDWEWHAVPTSDANDRTNTVFFDPSGQDNIAIDVYVAGTPGFTASPQQADENALLALDSKAVTHPGQPASVMYGGTSFVADSADVTLPNGQSRHAIALAALHGAEMYLIVYSAPPADFPTFDTTVLPTILQSLTFLS